MGQLGRRPGHSLPLLWAFPSPDSFLLLRLLSSILPLPVRFVGFLLETQI